MRYVKSFGVVVLYLAISFVLQRLIGDIFYKSDLQNGKDFKEVIDKNPHIPMILWFVISFIILMVITKPLKKKNIFEYCRFCKISIKESFIMMYIGLGAFIFNTSLINISWIDKNFPQFDSFLTFNYENSHIILGILSAVLIGPVYEEFLFRGLIFNELRETMPLLPAAFISSFLYGVLFFDIPLLLFCLAAALLYSFVYTRTKSLVSVIVIQLVATSGVLISRRMGIESVISNIGDIFIIPVFVLSILIILSGCYILRTDKRKESIPTSY